MLDRLLTIVRTANAAARWAAVKLAKIETRLERLRAKPAPAQPTASEAYFARCWDCGAFQVWTPGQVCGCCEEPRPTFAKAEDSEWFA